MKEGFHGTLGTTLNPPMLHHLPDTVPQGERYLDFESLYTSEKFRPSLAQSAHGMPAAQFAKNVVSEMASHL